MPALKIVLYASGSETLPLAYNDRLQGLLYSCWRERFPELHEDRPHDGGRNIRFFTFGRFRGKHNVDQERKTITFDDVVTFEVRSPFQDLIEEVAAQLAKRREITLAQRAKERHSSASGQESNMPPAHFKIANLQVENRLLFPETAHIRMRSPIAVHSTKDRHTIPIAPGERAFSDALQHNLESKMEALGIKSDSRLQIITLSNSLKPQVTTFKGTRITGWLGEFILSAPPDAMSLLYYAGIGARNSQGFGMFDIDDRPLL